MEYRSCSPRDTSRGVLLLIAILLDLLMSAVDGQCYNQCSGHGECTKYGHCECWSRFEGWDCSLRGCPSAPAWTDIASDTDTAHNVAVCSNRGVCNLETGECVCHKDFQGQACERMVCPNDCSDHGQCLSMAEAAAGLDGYRLTRVASYDAWDAHMIYGCICDDGYEGYDCSRRPCPQSDNGLTVGQQDESVIIYCRCGDGCSGTFRLRYKGQLTTIHPTNDEATVASKLMALSTVKSDTTEYTSPPVSVQFVGGETSVCSAGGTTSTVTFTRDPGDLPPVYIKFNRLSAPDGTDLHMTTEATLACTCMGTCGGHFRFVGEGGEATERLPYNAGEGLIATTLSELSDLVSANITVDMYGRNEACSDASTVNTTIYIDLDHGNCPLQVVGSLYDDGQQGGEVVLYTNDGTKEQEYCAGLGSCDFETGECSCDEDYGYDQEYGPCGQYVYTHSQWPGRQMCPGFELRPTIDILPSQTNDWQLYFTDAGKSSSNITRDPQFDSTVQTPGYYWFNIEDGGTDERVLFVNATNATTDLTNALALDMTYGFLYYGQHNNVMRMATPSGLSEGDLWASANGSVNSPADVFVTLPEGQAAGYLELDLRPDQRYLYWTVPGEESDPDGKVQRKKLSNGSDPFSYEDLSESIQWGMTRLGYNLTDPLGIALDLRDRKIYFVDAQVRGDPGGEDGVVIRCELDGSEVEIAANTNLGDPRAIVLDVNEGKMYLTDTHNRSLLRGDMRVYTSGSTSEMETIVEGVWQERRAGVEIETYYQPLLSPQSLQFDTREEDLGMLYFSDFETGYIYTVRTNGSDAEPYYLMGQPKSFIFDLGEGYPTYTLYSDCHGHGVCSGPPYFICMCEDGWDGNCQQNSCPQGPAWFDEAKTDGTAHAYAECSNRGHCDRNTSLCVCHDGFTGDACQRTTCPDDCSGNGKCLSMRQLALLATDFDLVPRPVSYGATIGNMSTWDADSLFGCYCDWMGYQGGGPSYTNMSDWTSYNCSRKTCPTGDDSKMARYNATEFEQQNVSCALLTGGRSQENATFSLSFLQGTTELIDGNVSLWEFEEALESLATIGDVEVGMWGEDKSTALCSVAGSPPASVVFKTELGNIPLLSVATSIGVSIEVTEEVEGTKLNIECSGHGHCDATIGECVCFDGWASSDGDGAVGHRLDCGWSPGEAGILIDS